MNFNKNKNKIGTIISIIVFIKINDRRKSTSNRKSKIVIKVIENKKVRKIEVKD